MDSVKGIQHLVFVLWLSLHLITITIQGIDGIRCIADHENLSQQEFVTNLIDLVPADHGGVIENLQLVARRDEGGSLFVPGNIIPSLNSNQQQGLQWPGTGSKELLKSSENLLTNVAEINVKDANDNPQQGTALADSSASQPQKQLVTISIDLLTSLIKGSRVPPSGPSKDHNWIASSTLPETTHKDAPPRANTVYFRIQLVDHVPKNDHVGNELPLIQDIGNSVTYRVQD